MDVLISRSPGMGEGRTMQEQLSRATQDAKAETLEYQALLMLLFSLIASRAGSYGLRLKIKSFENDTR